MILRSFLANHSGCIKQGAKGANTFPKINHFWASVDVLVSNFAEPNLNSISIRSSFNIVISIIYRLFHNTLVHSHYMTFWKNELFLYQDILRFFVVQHI